jgi:Raf kinase inhibitor-like YbhB/YbcL family protein
MQKNRLIPGVIVVLMFMAGQAFGGEFLLSSPDFMEGSVLQQEQVLNGFGCTGGNRSPELRWSGIPTGTKSFAITVYDPDAPTGSGWWHWVVFNIPATVRSLAGNSGDVNLSVLPVGAIQSRTDFGTAGFGGACPPAGDGEHRYEFTVWALDVEALPLDAAAPAAMVGFFLNQHQLGRAVITAVYGR